MSHYQLVYKQNLQVYAKLRSYKKNQNGSQNNECALHITSCTYIPQKLQLNFM